MYVIRRNEPNIAIDCFLQWHFLDTTVQSSKKDEKYILNALLPTLASLQSRIAHAELSQARCSRTLHPAIATEASNVGSSSEGL